MRKNVIIILFIFLFSCTTAGIQKTAPGPSDDLKDTVTMFYELRKQGRYVETWNYERMSTDENAGRRENSRRTYISKSGGGMPLKDYKILEIGKEGSGIEGFTPVKIKITAEWPPMPFPVPQGDNVIEMEDLWEKVDGKWYHIVRGITKFW